MYHKILMYAGIVAIAMLMLKQQKTIGEQSMQIATQGNTIQEWIVRWQEVEHKQDLIIEKYEDMHKKDAKIGDNYATTMRAISNAEETDKNCRDFLNLRLPKCIINELQQFYTNQQTNIDRPQNTSRVSDGERGSKALHKGLKS